MRPEVTYAEKYGPAMELTDPGEAARYFEACVHHTMETFGKSREAAEDIERDNLGYYAGYYDHETRRRVEHLFRCVHPLLGPATEQPMSAEEVYQRGVRLGRSLGGARR